MKPVTAFVEHTFKLDSPVEGLLTQIDRQIVNRQTDRQIDRQAAFVQEFF